MTGAAALIAVLLCGRARALDPRLAAAPDPEPGVFRGLVLSAGPGRPVCARATFDRRKAAAGGLVFVTDAGEAGDEDAIRLSEAVVARRGGLASRAGLLARRHGVPAVALGRGSWDAKTPALALEEPLFAPAGPGLRVAVAAKERILAEGSAVCVDAAAGLVALPPESEAAARVDAAAAARAYDGLRDASALERWLSGEPDAARAAALMRELAARSLDGGTDAADLARVSAAARAAAGPAGADALRRAERRGWSRARDAARAELSACAETSADAPSADVLDRLADEARETAARAAAAGRVLGTGDGDLRALARACAAAAARRRAKVPAESPSLEAAAAAAGASTAESRAVPAEAWERFVAENGLKEFLAETAGDASLGLRRKSERLRARVLGGLLSESSDAGRAILSAAPSCPCLVLGEGATLPAADARALLAAVRAAWAAGFDPGPLGARLRAGRGADFDARVRIARAAKADVSGLVFSREPGSARRGRAVVEAAPGGIEEFLSGGAAADHVALDARSGRVLEAVPAAADGKAVLSAERLKRLARLARALDAWSAGPVEVAFSFEGEALRVHHAKPLEPTRPPRPLSDPFAPAPAPEALGVKPVR